MNLDKKENIYLQLSNELNFLKRLVGVNRTELIVCRNKYRCEKEEKKRLIDKIHKKIVNKNGLMKHSN
jgi:hypothetical protein